MAQVVWRMRAKDETGPAFRGVRSAVLGVGAVAGLAAGAVAGVTGVAVKGAADFETGLRRVNTLLGLSEEQLNKFGEDLRALSTRTGADIGELAAGAYQALSNQIPFDEVLDFLDVANQAAVGGQTDISTAVNALTTVLNAYGRENITAAAAADILFSTVREGNVTFETLAASLGQIVTEAAQYGIPFAEVGAAIATLTVRGLPAKQAVTSLRAAINSLINPSAEVEELFQRFDFSAIDSIRERGLVGLLEDFNRVLGNSSDPLKAIPLLVTQEAVPALLALGVLDLENSQFYRSLANVNGGVGAANAAFEEFSKSTSVQFTQAMNRIQTALLPLGLAILPAINDQLMAFSTWIIENEDDIERVLSNFGGLIGAAIAEVGPFFSALTAGGDTFRTYIAGLMLDTSDEMVKGLANLLSSSAPYWIALGAQSVSLMLQGLLQLFNSLPEWQQALVGAALGASVGATVGGRFGFGGFAGAVGAVVGGLGAQSVLENLVRDTQNFDPASFATGAGVLGTRLTGDYYASDFRQDLFRRANPGAFALSGAGTGTTFGGPSAPSITINLNGDFRGDSDDAVRVADTIGGALTGNLQVLTETGAIQ